MRSLGFESGYNEGFRLLVLWKIFTWSFDNVLFLTICLLSEDMCLLSKKNWLRVWIVLSWRYDLWLTATYKNLSSFVLEKTRMCLLSEINPYVIAMSVIIMYFISRYIFQKSCCENNTSRNQAVSARCDSSFPTHCSVSSRYSSYNSCEIIVLKNNKNNQSKVALLLRY